MQISPLDMEWEVVDRLKTLLELSEGEEFGTTAAFSHFSAIVCWVCQRSTGNTHSRGSRVLNSLSKQTAGAEPWSIGGDAGARRMSDVLIALRNCLAHADERKVTPLNEDGVVADSTPQLRGFSFATSIGTFVFDESDMRRVGMGLASEFLSVMAPKEAARK